MNRTDKKVRAAVVLMASGFGKRYGSNKLLETLEGKPLFTYGVEQALGSGADRVIVVTRFPEIQDYVCRRMQERKNLCLYGQAEKTMKKDYVQIVWNPHPQRGISESLKLGLRAAEDCDGCCFMVCDQPLLKKSTVKALLNKFREDPRYIYLCQGKKGRGNPVLFPVEYYKALFLLEGDQGGKQVLKKYPEQIRTLTITDDMELEDMDAVEDRLVLEDRLRTKLRESI